MMVLSNEISTEDISYVLENPWEITAREWGLRDEMTRKDTQIAVLQYLKLAERDGYSTVWKTQDDKPIAILGGYKTAEKRYVTFFVASCHMDEFALKLSFAMRTLLRQKSMEYRGCKCVLFSTSDHPRQITWFRFLGFTYSPAGNIGNARYFEYESPSV